MKKNIKNKIKDPDFYRHKVEKLLFVISAFLSLAIFILLSYLGYAATLGKEERNLISQIFLIESDFVDAVLNIGGYIAIALIIFFIINILITYYKYRISAKAYDVHISERQLPMLIKAEKEYAKKLGINRLPKLFVSIKKEDLETHGIRISNPNVIRIPCEEIIATANKGYYGAKFAIAKHLANEYLGYNNLSYFIPIIFSNWIPVFSQLGGRIKTYSTDKVAADLIGKEEAIDAIFEDSVNIWFIKYMNRKEYINNTKNVTNDRSMIFANILSYVPIPAYRIDAIKNDKYGKLF